MRTAILIALAIHFLVGCTTRMAGIVMGTPMTHVQLDLGLPDVISDSSGDETRYYTPQDRPESEWPAEAPRTFFCLERDLRITFVRGRAVNASPIEDGKEEIVRWVLERGND